MCDVKPPTEFSTKPWSWTLNVFQPDASFRAVCGEEEFSVRWPRMHRTVRSRDHIEESLPRGLTPWNPHFAKDNGSEWVLFDSESPIFVSSTFFQIVIEILHLLEKLIEGNDLNRTYATAEKLEIIYLLRC